ncbi:cytochrome c oxidase subunit IV [Motilibacter rhizosphaerae]|uniref:Cytochrome c oxidase polypeptide 4 n=1 Tax=Motilibacter rhizosphaerae TaxID=598652 RepID=A0A4Q7NRE8_9ACTN|nr:cytochrome c oxidase subunit 4 [Motilibacter rhizosphaerae]RZS89555.1 cytochrome c oxidase subunit IV [Motilibacter rhizosphaerae]
MKVEGLLFSAGVVFFLAVGIVYGLITHEPAGTCALLFTAGLAALTGFYTLFTGHRLGMRPEDRKDAEIEENAGELGFFSPGSWWPLFLGGSIGGIALGLAVGWWLVAVVAPFLLLSILGLVFEYYRGEHAH